MTYTKIAELRLPIPANRLRERNIQVGDGTVNRIMRWRFWAPEPGQIERPYKWPVKGFKEVAKNPDMVTISIEIEGEIWFVKETVVEEFPIRGTKRPIELECVVIGSVTTHFHAARAEITPITDDWGIVAP